jgi:hypothetical protein
MESRLDSGIASQLVAKRSEIEALCLHTNVLSLDLFGSVSSTEFRPPNEIAHLAFTTSEAESKARTSLLKAAMEFIRETDDDWSEPQELQCPACLERMAESGYETLDLTRFAMIRHDAGRMGLIPLAQGLEILERIDTNCARAVLAARYLCSL